MQLESSIFTIQTEEEFDQLTMEIFHFQAKKCSVYKDFLEKLGHPTPTNVNEIPFLPISFFKTHEIVSVDNEAELTFLSSGTTGMTRSKHYIHKAWLYEQSFLKTYSQFIGNPEEQVILALLPNYIEQGDSSLVYMVDHLITKSQSELSGFLLDDLDTLLQRYQIAVQSGKKVVIFGVSYALLDLADRNVDLSGALIIETGGMKGRRKEMTKVELHEVLKKGLNVPYISSEYGMTELLSQAYSDRNGLFTQAPWMRIICRDVNDPLTKVSEGKTGGINVIDLANLYSCSFIATQDLGKIEGNTFSIMGRFNNADIRGCNLMVE